MISIIKVTAYQARAIREGRQTQMRKPVTRGNSLVDGAKWYHEDWKRLWVPGAYSDDGPSPAGNAGPYLHVLDPENDTRHRVYPRVHLGNVLRVNRTKTLIRIMSIRAQRLLDISEADISAEGFDKKCDFIAAWNVLYANHGFSLGTSPWVWVYGFKLWESADAARND
jgi:hypothetical protein